MKVHTITTAVAIAVCSLLPSSAQITLPLPYKVSVFGTIQMERIHFAASAQPVTFQLTPYSINPYKVGRPVTLTCWIRAEGRYGFDIPSGHYIVTIKGRKWLAKTIRIDTRNGSVRNVQAVLRSGDANNDNLVDVLDLHLLIQGFDSQSGDLGWDERADFNCDDIEDVDDLDLFIRNFDLQGDR